MKKLCLVTVTVFALALADVADPQVPGSAIEAIAKRVSQSVGPDFIVAGDAHKGVGRRDGIVLRQGGRRAAGEVVAVDVDAQHLAEEIVGNVLGVAGADGVAGVVIIAAPTVA